MSVFLDVDSITIFDPDHSDDEDRWVTIGEAIGQKLLLVVHTHVEIEDDVISVRMISARRPTRKEAGQYRHRV